MRRILQNTQAFAPFPTVADRDAWEARLDHPVARIILGMSDSVAASPVPALPATLALDFDRSGQRQPFEAQYFSRRTRLNVLALAECLKNEGQYLPAIIETMQAICDESNWAMAFRLRPTGPVDIDIYATGTGMLLAETDYLLGDLLPAELRARVRQECQARLIQPYLSATEFTWTT
ncbi:MAG TPA: hypothetical protein VNT26_20920, partial [Candidatus Sulfotelmatobacter sp.]|nr:hypothetical protein [Candidatus Sulfotelmatobacter sp.]